jgi:predicted GIY-YIG superfamily endonuclease
MAQPPTRFNMVTKPTTAPASTLETRQLAKSGAAPIKKVRARSAHYHVYVIELDDRVWNSGKFRRCNPEYQMGKPFVYVGMTGLDPDTRFDKHKAGIQANKFVTDYGVRLLPALYEKYNPMPYQAAKEMEVELAIALQSKGLGVWQG